MRHFSSVKNSSYLTRNDVQNPTPVTITSVTDELVGLGEDKESKFVVHFEEFHRGLVLNFTNAETIAYVLREEDMDKWAGRQIILFDDPMVSYAGKRVGGIRVRAANPSELLDEQEAALVNALEKSVKKLK